MILEFENQIKTAFEELSAVEFKKYSGFIWVCVFFVQKSCFLRLMQLAIQEANIH